MNRGILAKERGSERNTEGRGRGRRRKRKRKRRKRKSISEKYSMKKSKV